jgi:hypothetical protein
MHGHPGQPERAAIDRSGTGKPGKHPKARSQSVMHEVLQRGGNGHRGLPSPRPGT